MNNRQLSLKIKRRSRVRKKIIFEKTRPRLSIFRSNKYIYAQIIDDKLGKTLAAANDKGILDSKIDKKKNLKAKQEASSDKQDKKLQKFEKAALVGEAIAQKAKKIGKIKVNFDRGSYKYHGRIKSLADAARKSGMEF